MKYLVQSKFALFALRTIDTFLKRSEEAPIPKDPKRILLANIAHLGDVLIATSILTPLKQKYPQAEIGFLCGSWAKPILEGQVDYLHFYNHWKLNRGNERHSFKEAVAAIRAVNYDLAIDLYPYFPNAIPLLKKANIPVRIGFSSGGFGPYLTHSHAWRGEQHMAQAQLDLLKIIGVASDELRPSLARITDPSIEGEYIVLHMGAGSSLKEWPLDKWRALVKRLPHYTLVFTGRGAHEKKNIEQVCPSDGVNLCDKLDFAALAGVIKNCKLLITVDSAPAHIGSVFNTETLVLFCGINDSRQWRPLHARAKILMQPVACAPCHNKKGCASMSCIKEIDVETVFQEVRKYL